MYLRNQKDPHGKFSWWITELEEYNYTIKYVPGVENVKADPFSRNRAADPAQPESQLESKTYEVVDNQNISRTALYGTKFRPSEIYG